jgi:hypothetical protein
MQMIHSLETGHELVPSPLTGSVIIFGERLFTCDRGIIMLPSCLPLKTYINHTVRHGTTPTLAGFKQHFGNAHQKKIDSVKTDKAKASKTEAANADMAHVSTNRAHFQRALDMHKLLPAVQQIHCMPHIVWDIKQH